MVKSLLGEHMVMAVTHKRVRASSNSHYTALCYAQQYAKYSIITPDAQPATLGPHAELWYISCRSWTTA